MNLFKCPTNSFYFPDISCALEEPNGLLAWGGDLSVKRLLNAYTQGIFPWFSEDELILWWSPNPRCVFDVNNIKISTSMQKFILKENYKITFNENFAQVIEQCSQPRKKQSNTWISTQMKYAYLALHNLSYAHSIEIWQDNEHKKKLVGGLYGVLVDNVFSGESMFSIQPNTSKLAFYCLATHLKNWGLKYIDAQIESRHLLNLGAITITREKFISHKKQNKLDAKIKFNYNEKWKDNLSENIKT